MFDTAPTHASNVRFAAPKRLYQRGAMAGNTRRGRRIRKLMLEFGDLLGGFASLTVADQAMVMECATKTVESEEMRDRLSRGECNPEQSVRLGNILSRLLRQLDRRRGALAPKPSSPLVEHFSRPPARPGD